MKNTIKLSIAAAGVAAAGLLLLPNEALAKKPGVLEGKPVVVEARMQTQNNHITDLIIDSIERRDDLSEANFTPAALEHM